MKRENNLLPHHGEAYIYPLFFSKEESDRFLVSLLKEVQWKQEPIRIFGKTVMQPRLTAWYADDGVNYSYSGITMHSQPWTAALKEIKERIGQFSGERFNSALLNLYRDGNDSMGWHRDNEKELGKEPVIGSVSFGAARKFQFRSYKDKSDLLSLDLDHGSFLLMRGEIQDYWEHRVPKTAGNVAARINITFREVVR